MLTDSEIYELSRQADELRKEFDADIKSKEPLTVFGSFRLYVEKDGLWSKIKVNNKEGSYLTWGKAIYPIDCVRNPNTEVGECADMDAIVSFNRQGRNYLRGERDVHVDWSERNGKIPDLNSYVEYILKPLE